MSQTTEGSTARELSRIDRKQNQAIFVTIIVAVIALVALLSHINSLNTRVLILENVHKTERIKYAKNYKEGHRCCTCNVLFQENKQVGNQGFMSNNR